MLLRLFLVVVIVLVSGFQVMVCRRRVVRRCLQMVFACRVLLFRHESSSCEDDRKVLGWLMFAFYPPRTSRQRLAAIVRKAKSEVRVN